MCPDRDLNPDDFNNRGIFLPHYISIVDFRRCGLDSILTILISQLRFLLYSLYTLSHPFGLTLARYQHINYFDKQKYQLRIV